MRMIGLFRELDSSASESIPSIRDVVNELTGDQARLIANHLRNGVPVVDFMETTFDPFDKKICFPGGSSLLSDGTWVWRDDLAYFVETYRVGLAADFVMQALANGLVRASPDSVIEQWKDVLAAYERAKQISH